MAGSIIAKTISQEVVTGTTQPIYLGGTATDGSDAPIQISASKVANLNAGTTVGGNPVASQSYADGTISKNTSGYTKLSNGMVFQWTAIAITANPTIWTFPIAFPTICLGVSGSMYRISAQDYLGIETIPHSSTTQVSLRSSSTMIWAYVFAWGY